MLSEMSQRNVIRLRSAESARAGEKTAFKTASPSKSHTHGLECRSINRSAVGLWFDGRRRSVSNQAKLTSFGKSQPRTPPRCVMIEQVPNSCASARYRGT